MDYTALFINTISLLAIVVLLGITLLFLYALIFGAPYAPSATNRISTMIKLLKLKKGQKVADLGSGDGRVVIALAKEGIEAHGYEINPVLVLISRMKIRKAGLQNKAFIHFKDFWQDNFSKFDAVTIYVSPLVTGRLGKKLKREMKGGSRAVSHSFRLPNLESVKSENNIFLYSF
jgi:cyclopropane fatty-acyl-phospholipid synthase-like methyltransferase